MGPIGAGHAPLLRERSTGKLAVGVRQAWGFGPVKRSQIVRSCSGRLPVDQEADERALRREVVADDQELERTRRGFEDVRLVGWPGMASDATYLRELYDRSPIINPPVCPDVLRCDE